MSDCLFCQILTGAIPSVEVGSSASSYAFRDIDPKAPTHVLVIPRRHIPTADDLGAEHAAELMDLVLLAKQVARGEGLVVEGRDPNDEGGYRLVFNVGKDAGNMVAHLHLHLVGGRMLGWPPG